MRTQISMMNDLQLNEFAKRNETSQKPCHSYVSFLMPIFQEGQNWSQYLSKPQTSLQMKLRQVNHHLQSFSEHATGRLVKPKRTLSLFLSERYRHTSRTRMT